MMMTHTTTTATQTQEDASSRTRFIATLLLLIGAIVCVVALSVVTVSHMFFEHVSCKIAESTVDGAWVHARTIASKLLDTAEKAGGNAFHIITQSPELVRREIMILVEEDPAILYGGVVSSEGEMLIHTDKSLEGSSLKQGGLRAPEISPRVRALPGGRRGFKEYLYEVRVPIDATLTDGYDLIIGISRARIDKHISEVNRDVRTRMAVVGGMGAVILLLPSAALWWILRRHAAMRRRAEAVAHMAQIGELASGLAHEIRNPLNAVRFNLKILEENAARLDEDIAGPYAELAQRAAEEVSRVDGLLAEYLDFAKPQRRTKDLHDLNDVVHEAVRFIDHECRRHGISVILDLSDDAAGILMDRHRIKQAVLNLLINAQKELRETGGSIAVKTTVEAQRVLLTVVDDGSGILEENRERVFEPFWTGRQDGVGLGLSITRQIIEDHEGGIFCKPAPNGGAAFTISLPYTRPTGKGSNIVGQNDR